jgi:hypothetical protein
MWITKHFNVNSAEMREVVAKLLKASSGSDTVLNLKEPLDFEICFTDTACVKTAIHFPVDWILFRDAVRTLMKAVILIRREGLKHRMKCPQTFLTKINRLKNFGKIQVNLPSQKFKKIWRGESE